MLRRRNRASVIVRVLRFILMSAWLCVLNMQFAHGSQATAAALVRGSIDQARGQLNVNPEKALASARSAAVEAAQTVDSTQRAILLVEADSVIARALIGLRRIDEADSVVNQAFAHAKNTAVAPKFVAELILSRGRIRQHGDDVQGALADFQKAYAIFRSVGEARSQAVALQSIAKLYIDGGDAENAIKYYIQSGEEYAGDPQMSLSQFNNRGAAYIYLDKPRQAEHEFKAALGIAEKISSTKYTTRILANIAQAQIDQKHYSEAAYTVDRAFASAETTDTAGEWWALWHLRAQIALARKNLELATIEIERALRDVDLANSDSTYRHAHETAYQIYRMSGRKPLALVHLESVWRLDKARAKLTASYSAALMAARFDFASQTTRIAQLKAKELELQRNLLIAVIAGGTLVMLLLSVGLILITRSRNRERAAKLVLAETNVQLEKAIAAKMEFLATTSHEIRTPLNGILGMTQVILADRRLASILKDQIGVVHSAGEAMRALVDDILDVAKMETGKLTIGTGNVDLQTTLRQVAQVWRLQAESTGINLVVDVDNCPGWIEGDGGRIRQIVFNLLSNAMKFTESGDVILSAGTVLDGDARRIRISVRDSGIGIAAEWHESIFELFQQVDGGTTRQYGGTGLGLAICRNLAQAMDGDITVQSEPGFGSTFTIDLPLVEPEIAIAIGTETAEQRSGVLVIERNPLTRGMMRAILAQRFADILFVDDIASACGVLALETIDWIVVDASSVDDFAPLLAATNVPIVVVQGSDPLPDSVRTQAAVVLTKPLSKAALLNALICHETPHEVAA